MYGWWNEALKEAGVKQNDEVADVDLDVSDIDSVEEFPIDYNDNDVDLNMGFVDLEKEFGKYFPF